MYIVSCILVAGAISWELVIQRFFAYVDTKSPLVLSRGRAGLDGWEAESDGGSGRSGPPGKFRPIHKFLLLMWTQESNVSCHRCAIVLVRLLWLHLRACAASCTAARMFAGRQAYVLVPSVYEPTMQAERCLFRRGMQRDRRGP